MIDQITDKILQHLSTALQIDVDAYSRIHKRTPLPCARLRLAEMDPMARQSGNGQTSVNLRFELFLISVPEIQGANITLQMLAAQAIHALHQPTRLLPNFGTIKVTGSNENGFDPDFDGYLTWQIDFSLSAMIGDANTWQVPGLPPQQAYVDMDPSTDQNPIEDYETLNDQS